MWCADRSTQSSEQVSTGRRTSCSPAKTGIRSCAESCVRGSCFKSAQLRKPSAESASAVAAADASGHQYLGLAAQNAASIALGARRFELVPDFAKQAADASQDPASREMAAAYTALMRSSHDGSLPAIARQLELMLVSQLRRGQLHYAGITSLNLAQLLVWLDQGELAIRRAGDAEQYLQRSSRGYELVSVRLVQAQAQAQLGRWADCEASLRQALDTQHPEGEVEAVLEAAAIAAWFGPAGLAQQIVNRVDRGDPAAPLDIALASSGPVAGRHGVQTDDP